MFGLSFSWARTGDDLHIIYPHRGVEHSVPTSDIDRELIERVEVLAEAAERARLLLHMLPERLKATKSADEWSARLREDFYEAEDALWCALHPE